MSRSISALVFVTAVSACSTDSREPAGRVVRVDRSDFPLLRATPEELERFQTGDALFDVTLREADGLGPLYIRASCSACHAGDARGPGMVRKMSATHGADAAAALPHGDTERPYTAAGAKSPLVATPGGDVHVTQRFPPAVFGRGYMEAVSDAEIERLAREAAARSGPIRGRIHRVRYDSEPNPRPGYASPARGTDGLIGRFGLKARIATLDEFSADALQGDMGITSPLRPTERSNPDGLADDRKPGIDVNVETVNLITDYVRLLELPERQAASERDAELFRTALCADCHVPALETRADYPIRALSGIEAPVYTDFLLHDMGEGLADGIAEGDASPREWRTAPLIGLRFFPAFLHDGRAKNVEAAILAHRSPGSEATVSVERFLALSDAERRRLVAFVETL